MSTPQRVDVSESVWPNSQVLHEIKWCEDRIELLLLNLQRKPSTIKQINDLRRQIEDKRKVLQYRLESNH